MKGTGQYLCEAACDEDEETEEEEDEKEEEEAETEEEETENDADNFNIIYYEYKCNKCGYTTSDSGPDCTKCEKTGCMLAHETGLEQDEDTMNCDICCENKDGEKYYIFRRGNKQELWSCVDCWESQKEKLHNELWRWKYYINSKLEESEKSDLEKEEETEKEEDTEKEEEETENENKEMPKKTFPTHIVFTDCDKKEGKDSNNIIKSEYDELPEAPPCSPNMTVPPPPVLKRSTNHPDDVDNDFIKEHNKVTFNPITSLKEPDRNSNDSIKSDDSKVSDNSRKSNDSLESYESSIKAIVREESEEKEQEEKKLGGKKFVKHLDGNNLNYII